MLKCIDKIFCLEIDDSIKMQETYMEVTDMSIGVNIALAAFGIMVSIAVLAAVIAAVSTVSGFDKPDDCDE